MTRRLRSDDGSVLVLTLGFAGLCIVLVAVVTNVSVVILAKRAVSSAADGAAISAAQSLDLAGLYAEGLDRQIPLSQGLAQQRVADYRARADDTQPGLQLTVQVAQREATVVATRQVEVPFRLPGTGLVTVRSVARARAPVV